MEAIAAMLQPTARNLLDAWLRLERRDCVPDRGLFNPMSVARILPVVSLVERIDDDEWRLRLVGTEIERRWGRTLTGCNYLDLVSSEAAPMMLEEFRQVIRQPCGSWSLRKLQLRSGATLTVETLRLPLRGADGSVNLILGCSGEISRAYHTAADNPRAIATIANRHFFDIGAGVPMNTLI